MYDIRGLMLDPARLTERRTVYRDYIAMAAQWRYNALFWHFTDDQGCALRFPSHPELASPYAYAPDEMRELIAFAARHGMEVIPELECFGHAEFITAHPRYQHLRDGVHGKLFGALCIFEPEARALLRDLLRDTAELFPSPYLHAGLDETAFGAHPASARALARTPKHLLYAEHVCWLHSEITRLGKTMLMWADHLYPLSARDFKRAAYLDAESINSAIAAQLPRDIIMCVWQYNPKPRSAYVEHLQRLGFRVLVCPATSAWGLLVHPRTWNLQNLADSASLARRRRALGMINTVWCPQRYFPGVTLFGVAYGAVCRDARQAHPRPPYARFVRNTFGIAAPAPVARAIKRLHEATPHKNTLERALPVAGENLLKITAAEHRALRTLHNAARQALACLTNARADVRRNRTYFDDLVFSAYCLSELGSSGMAARVLVGRAGAAHAAHTAGRLRAYVTHLTACRAVAEVQLERLRPLLRAAKRRWNATRHPGDPKRTASHAAVHGDALLARIDGAVRYYSAVHKDIAKALRTGAAISTL